MESGIRVRPATLADAAHLAMLVDIAGRGMPVRVWQGLAEPGQSPLEVGRARAMREQASFSYRNASVAEDRGEVVGALIGYVIVPDESGLASMPPQFRPIQELENEAAGHWYVYVLAVYPEARGRGIGGHLLREADRIGAAMAPGGMAIIVDDANTGAHRLYQRHGYRVAATRPIVPVPGLQSGERWLLLTKPHG
jgi:ribosomal protein S18 acetylase RimI-like enzyme